MFHRGHYNKIVDVLGRRIAAEYCFGTEESYQGAINVAGGFGVMLGDDNSEFDVIKFLDALKTKTEEYVANMGVGSPISAYNMEAMNANLRSRLER